MSLENSRPLRFESPRGSKLRPPRRPRRTAAAGRLNAVLTDFLGEGQQLRLAWPAFPRPCNLFVPLRAALSDITGCQ